MKRCVNIDWLEVFVFEPLNEPRNAAWFMLNGYFCNVREYGTPVYNEMFTIMDDRGNPFIEVRRDPKSQIMSPCMCHIRLHNSYCYRDDAAYLMYQFIESNGFTFQRISRVDICLDFEKFDSGDDPQKFLYRYINRTYAKINQSRLTAHGSDTWTERKWNSLSWGSPSSDIGTKFYNKTMELYDETSGAYKKPYIRYAWQCCGLIDDWQKVTKKAEDGSEYTPQIWRIEFSIRSNVKKWFAIELDGHQRTHKGRQKHLQSVHNTLDMYAGRDKLLVLFASLAQHYFRFKYFKEDTRKDRCPDKVLFRWQRNEVTYAIGKDNTTTTQSADRAVTSLLNRMRQYQREHNDAEVKKACAVIIRCLEQEQLRGEILSPLKQEEINALRLVLSYRMSGDQTDAAILMRQVKQALRLNDKTLPFFPLGK